MTIIEGQQNYRLYLAVIGNIKYSVYSKAYSLFNKMYYKHLSCYVKYIISSFLAEKMKHIFHNKGKFLFVCKSLKGKSY